MSPVTDALAWLSGYSDPLAWLVVALFVAVALLEPYDRDLARRLGAATWTVFGVFWLAVFPVFLFEMRSGIEGVLSLAAVPLSVYVGYLLLSGRDSLFVLTRAGAIMGAIYLPFETIPVVRQWLIETTAYQAHIAMDLVAESPGLETGGNGYHSRFAFDPESTATGRTTYIILACTGLGSMAIFGGLIASVRAPLRRKVAGIVASVGVIWFLNLIRNVFIALATPHGWFQQDVFVYLATEWMGTTVDRTSFLISHNLIFQPLSIVALIAITYIVIKIVPEVLEPLEEVLFILTGSEYDLAAALGTEPTRPETGKAAGD